MNVFLKASDVKNHPGKKKNKKDNLQSLTLEQRKGQNYYYMFPNYLFLHVGICKNQMFLYLNTDLCDSTRRAQGYNYKLSSYRNIYSEHCYCLSDIKELSQYLLQLTVTKLRTIPENSKKLFNCQLSIQQIANYLGEKNS